MCKSELTNVNNNTKKRPNQSNVQLYAVSSKNRIHELPPNTTKPQFVTIIKIISTHHNVHQEAPKRPSNTNASSQTSTNELPPTQTLERPIVCVKTCQNFKLTNYNRDRVNQPTNALAANSLTHQKLYVLHFELSASWCQVGVSPSCPAAGQAGTWRKPVHTSKQRSERAPQRTELQAIISSVHTTPETLDPRLQTPD